MGKPDWWLRRRKAFKRTLNSLLAEQREFATNGMVLPELDQSIALLEEAVEIIQENRAVSHGVQVRKNGR